MVSPVIKEEGDQNGEKKKDLLHQSQSDPGLDSWQKQPVAGPPNLAPPKPCVRKELQKYKEQLWEPISEETALDFWAAQGSVYRTIKPFALDLLAMPASQAFAERVFSITGDLSGCRNGARAISEGSAFLKLNRDQ